MRYAATLLLLAAAAQPVAAQDARWRPEDRVVLRDFSLVRAVAASEALVVGAADAGLVLRDRRFRRWLLPVTPLDGYPAEVVHAAFADPLGQTIWLGTDRALVRYEPMLGRFERVEVSGGVEAIMADPADPLGGVWIRVRGRWVWMARGALYPTDTPPPAGRPLTLAALYRRYPSAEPLGAQVLTDRRLRTYRFSGVARVPGTEEYWLGTSGMGLVRYDALIAQFERMPFGLLSDGVGALVRLPEGIWAATDGRGRRNGLSFTSPDLEQWRWDEGPPAIGFGTGGFRAALARRHHLWLASPRGVWRVEPEHSHELIGTADGLPDPEVFALAQGPAGVWVGTAGGLALIDDQDAIVVIDYDHPVLALSAARDTVWVGTPQGLGIAWPGADRILMRDDVLAVPELRGPILALGRTGDTIVAVTPQRIVWGGPRGRWTVERPLVELGTLRAAAGDDGGVWIGGTRGIAWFHYATRTFRVASGPADLPGAVRSLAVDEEYLWVGTERGLVRVRKRTLRP